MLKNQLISAMGGAPANYIEDVFSTYLYTGNGSTQTITNGIDLAGKGGLVWTKQRSSTQPHALVDTARGQNNWLQSNTTDAQINTASFMTFESNGYSTPNGYGVLNTNGQTYASWTFRKQPKFFDVVTWTGDGTGNRLIPHNLGSVAGCFIFRAYSSAANWIVYHQALGPSFYGVLNSTEQFYDNALSQGLWTQAPSATDLYIASNRNSSGVQYVAYLFAHDAGGFGESGEENVISCGSFTTDTFGKAVVELGWEPQFLITKLTTDSTRQWNIFDNMRGFANGASNDQMLYANTTSAEVVNANKGHPTATGFELTDASPSAATGIYIAIRRGPMRTPTTGTKVFAPVAYTGNATATTISAGFPVDMLAILRRSNPFGDGDGYPRFMDRLRGGNSTSLMSSSSSAEETSTNNNLYLDNSVGFKVTANNPGAPTGYYFNVSTNPYIAECFRRAPGFFDEVCYTGTGVNPTNINHNLAVAPELIIVKCRGADRPWPVYYKTPLVTGSAYLNETTAGGGAAGPGFPSAPTATTFAVNNGGYVNQSGQTYVAYLFASCPGVSKVGSYTGTGAEQTINCGFTSGARFVLVKRTDLSGGWYLWDSARGITSGNDPYFRINLSQAEVTSTNYVDAAATGFTVTASAPAEINASGGTFIFLAIA